MVKFNRIPSPPSNSAAYPIRALVPRGVDRREVHWQLTGDYPLNQGEEGACVGHGVAAELSALPIAIPTGQEFAFRLYELARAEDRKMGYNFPEGATVLGGLRAAKELGLIQGYRWAQSFEEIRDAVLSHGSVVMGTWWYTGMDSWDAHGLVQAVGHRRGGHAWTIVGYLPSHPIHGEVFEAINSWGPGWGKRGLFYITPDDLRRLFEDDGEAAIVTDTPQDPEPAPVPEPDRYFAGRWSYAFHLRSHWWVAPHRTFATRQAALDAGLRPCRVCSP